MIRESQERKISDINVKDKINLFSQKAKEEHALQARQPVKRIVKGEDGQHFETSEEYNLFTFKQLTLTGTGMRPRILKSKDKMLDKDSKTSLKSSRSLFK